MARACSLRTGQWLAMLSICNGLMNGGPHCVPEKAVACPRALRAVAARHGHARAVAVGKPKDGLVTVPRTISNSLLESFRLDEFRISGRQGDERYSSKYWFTTLMRTPKSLVLRRILPHMLFNILVTSVVLGARSLLSFRPAVPITVHTLLGGYLSLLLVFRTNSAYARFWEGRNIWGQVKNTCVDITLSIGAYLRPHAPAAATEIESALLLYPNALSRQCRAELVEGSLDPYALALRMHKAVYAAAQEAHQSGASRDNVAVRLFELQLSRLSGHIDKLADAAGACSRITNTPVPLSYSRHTSRFLSLWLGTLPFVLANAIGAALTLPCVMLTCWMLLGIEELGHLIEQPFEVHPHLQEVDNYENAESYDFGVPTVNLANNIALGVRAILKELDEASVDE